MLPGVGTVARHLKPKIQLIGVQTTLYPSMYNLFKATSLPLGGDTLAEGIAVIKPGVITASILKDLVAEAIGAVGANIVEVYHQRVFTDFPAKGTKLNLVIETRDKAHLDKALEALKLEGYRVAVKKIGLSSEKKY